MYRYPCAPAASVPLGLGTAGWLCHPGWLTARASLVPCASWACLQEALDSDEAPVDSDDERHEAASDDEVGMVWQLAVSLFTSQLPVQYVCLCHQH